MTDYTPNAKILALDAVVTNLIMELEKKGHLTSSETDAFMEQALSDIKNGSDAEGRKDRAIPYLEDLWGLISSRADRK